MARFGEEEEEQEEGKVVAREEILTERKVIQPLRLHDFASANEKSFHRIFRRKYICVRARCMTALRLYASYGIFKTRETVFEERRYIAKCAIPVC